MNVRVSDSFKERYANLYNIRPTHAESVANSPDKSKVVKPALDLTIHFFSKHIPQAKVPHYLVVQAAEEGNDLRVDMAFRAYDDLHENIALLGPTELLYEIVQRFGLDVQIGSRTEKIILDEKLDVLPGQDRTNLMKVINPDNKSFTTMAHIRLRNEPTGDVIDCALAYAIDDDAYVKYLQSH